MPIKHCQHCTKAYQVHHHQLDSVLCAACTQTCQSVCEQLKFYMEAHGLSEINRSNRQRVIKETGVADVFIRVLTKDGRLTLESLNVDPRLCRRCRQTQVEADREICSACNAVLSKQLHGFVHTRTQSVVYYRGIPLKTPRHNRRGM